MLMLLSYVCSSSSFLQPGLPAQNFSMSVTVPVSNPNTLTYSNPGSSLVSPSLAASSSLTDTTMLSPPQTTLHRNVSPGAPQRPPSTGNAGKISVLLCFPFVLSFIFFFIKLKKPTNKKPPNNRFLRVSVLFLFCNSLSFEVQNDMIL